MAGEKDLGETWLVKKLLALLPTIPEEGMFPGEKYFTKPGSEEFNGGMEHYPVILLDDTMKNVKESERWNVMNRSKNILYAGAVSIDGKGKDAFPMALPWVVAQLLNTDPESLTAFPMVGGDTDKICGFLAGRYHEAPRMGRKMKRMPWMRPGQGSCPLWRGSLTITRYRGICRNLRAATGAEHT